MVFCSCYRYIHTSAFFFKLCFVKLSFRKRENAFFEPYDENIGKFESFGSVDTHELDSISFISSCFFDACHQRYFFHKLDHSFFSYCIILCCNIYELSDIFHPFFRFLCSFGFDEILFVFDTFYDLFQELFYGEHIDTMNHGLQECVE